MTTNFGRNAIVRLDRQDGSSEEFTGFRVVFEVNLSKTDSVDVQRINIYNLLPSRASTMSSGDIVTLRTFYSGFAEETFLVSSLVHARIFKEGPLFVTKMELADLSLQQAFFQASYRGEYRLHQIIRDVVTSANLAWNAEQLETLVPNNVFNNWSGSGRSIDILTDILRPYNVKAKERSGVIHFYHGIKSISDLIIRVTETLGMIGSPVDTDDGCRVKTLLNPNIEPGIFVDLQSQFAKGVFEVNRVVHRGDTGRRGEWSTEFYCTHATNV